MPNRLTVRVGRFPSRMIRRRAAEGGDDGVVVRVGVVRVVHRRVVAVVFGRSSGNADIRFTNISGTRGLKPACVILLRGPDSAVVVTDAIVAANHGRIRRCFGKGDLSFVAQLRGPGVAEDFGAFQGAVGDEARGPGAGGVVRLLAGGGDINGKF